jgi:alpha-beta hydrolase superfamily lysophospholipase
VPHLLGAEREPEGDGMERLRLLTDGGAITCRLHPTPEGDAAVLWVFGAGGGLGGPAGGLYPRLAQRLRSRGVLSVELAWRQPARMGPCVADLLAGLDWLAGQGRRRVALVGHSFGGAVVIAAGAAREEAVAVAARSSQTAGTELAGALAPRPLLVVHGLMDEILPADCSRDIHRRAAEPKEIILYSGCRHGLDECRDALDRDLLDWLSRVLGQAPA